MTPLLNRLSFEAQLALLLVSLAVIGASIAVVVSHQVDETWVALVVSLAVTVPLGLWILDRYLSPISDILAAITAGVGGLTDGDFSYSIARTREDEFGELVAAFNRVGDVLRRERQNLFQRELLLDTVIQSSPLALVLVNARGQVLYANTAARHQFLGGRKLDGLRFDDVVQDAPGPLRDAVLERRDGLFTLEAEPDPETWHISTSRFTLNGQDHSLFLFKQLTRELSRQEVATWKKVIRVISHELNNSLAPISSLAHSGAHIAEDAEQDKLVGLFETIGGRASHLKGFIEGYARFAKLPAPRQEEVDLAPFLSGLRDAVGFELLGDGTGLMARFDPAQIEQVLINLLKNAHESGSPREAVQLRVLGDGDGLLIQVLDRGSGMSEAVLANALLPFYSTKGSGTGLGLPLCREIVEAHEGRLSMRNRPEGGLEVDIWLPRLATA